MDAEVQVERLQFALKEMVETVERYHQENLKMAQMGFSKASTIKYRAVATRFGNLVNEVRKIRDALEEKE